MFENNEPYISLGLMPPLSEVGGIYTVLVGFFALMIGFGLSRDMVSFAAPMSATNELVHV
jgi:hypothetical protein